MFSAILSCMLQGRTWYWPTTPRKCSLQFCPVQLLQGSFSALYKEAFLSCTRKHEHSTVPKEPCLQKSSVAPTRPTGCRQPNSSIPSSQTSENNPGTPWKKSGTSTLDLTNCFALVRPSQQTWRKLSNNWPDLSQRHTLIIIYIYTPPDGCTGILEWVRDRDRERQG